MTLHVKAERLAEFDEVGIRDRQLFRERVNSNCRPCGFLALRSGLFFCNLLRLFVADEAIALGPPADHVGIGLIER